MSRPTELLICTTCRMPDASGDTPSEGPTAGQALFDRVQDALDLQALSAEGDAIDSHPGVDRDGASAGAATIRLRGIACLAACDRSCSMALQAPGKTSYVFGALTPDDECAQAVLTVAHEHARRPDGVLVWADRPQRLRRGIVARLPAPTAV